MDFGRSLGHQFLIVTSAGMAPAFLFSRLAVRGDRPKKKIRPNIILATFSSKSLCQRQVLVHGFGPVQVRIWTSSDLADSA